jgi:uncharacterized surface protein with fasciclin (FAS1) repeats
MKKDENVFDVIKSDGRFGILSKMLETSGLAEVLSKERETFTLFAPTDDAFSDLSSEALKFLTSGKGKNLVTAIIGHHLVPKSYLYSEDLRKRDALENMIGIKLEIRKEKNVLQLGEAHILTPGITALNGVVFPIDKVLPMIAAPIADALRCNN